MVTAQRSAPSEKSGILTARVLCKCRLCALLNNRNVSASMQKVPDIKKVMRRTPDGILGLRAKSILPLSISPQQTLGVVRTTADMVNSSRSEVQVWESQSCDHTIFRKPALRATTSIEPRPASRDGEKAKRSWCISQREKRDLCYICTISWGL